MSEVKPIRPEEVAGLKGKMIPSEVIEAFNTLITKNYECCCREAKVEQDEVVKTIMKKMGMKFGDRHMIFENNWLEIEEIFSEAGWKVTYDKPAYNEPGEATFIFAARPRPKKG